MKLLSY